MRKLGLMYPGLSTLVLANNSVKSVADSQEMLRRLFPNLRSINLSNSGLRWTFLFFRCSVQSAVVLIPTFLVV